MTNIITFTKTYGLVLFLVIFGLTTFIQGSIERDRQEKIDSLIDEVSYCAIVNSNVELSCGSLVNKNLDILVSSYGLSREKAGYLILQRYHSLKLD